MHRTSRNYYQIYGVDHKRNQEQMVAELEGLHEAEKLVENCLRNMSAYMNKKMNSAITGAPFRAAYQRCSGYRGPANSLSSASAVATSVLRWEALSERALPFRLSFGSSPIRLVKPKFSSALPATCRNSSPSVREFDKLRNLKILHWSKVNCDRFALVPC
jgi:hypothetical protein